MNDIVNGISSMAVRHVLAELCRACEREAGIRARFESVGGIDAAARVRGGEAFDIVVLAADAIAGLVAEGHVHATRCAPLLQSTVAVAVPRGAPRPDIGSADALRETVLAARRIGYSTGPSGAALLRLFERWGEADRLSDRLVQARAGTPVAALLADGQADLGFQQLSELKDEPGIAVLGPMPPELEILTTFVGGVGARSARADAAGAVLAFFSSPSTAALKQRYGMTAVRGLETTALPTVQTSERERP